MISVRQSDGLAQIGKVSVREASGLVEIAKISVREVDGLKVIYTSGGSGGSFDVSAVPVTPFGAAASLASVTITTEIVTVSANNGVSPYTYAWSIVDALDAWSISVVGDGQARFSRPDVGPGDSYDATFVCTVTDAAGREVATPVITATVTNYGRY